MVCRAPGCEVDTHSALVEETSVPFVLEHRVLQWQRDRQHDRGDAHALQRWTTDRQVVHWRICKTIVARGPSSRGLTSQEGVPQHGGGRESTAERFTSSDAG